MANKCIKSDNKYNKASKYLKFHKNIINSLSTHIIIKVNKLKKQINN